MSLNIETSKDGYKILKIDKDDKQIYLGSKYNQKREIDKFISSIKEFTDKDNFIVFGLSFCEHIKELLKLINKDSKILVVEVNRELVDYCKNDQDIIKIIENPKITVTFDKSEIEKFMLTNIKETNADRLKILEYCNYTRIYKKEYEERFKLIRDLLMNVKINRNTISAFGDAFLSNTISNLKYISNSNPINKLENVYLNEPAIIVSAGPSLIKNIDELKGINNALILSGGRTIESLLTRNISPTCLGVTDPGEVSYKLVENCIDKVKVPLIFSDMTNEKVVSSHKGEKFFYTISDLISRAFKQKIPTLYGGGSIAHSLINLAIYMGCNPIIFIGQDLAYTDEKNHASFCRNSWDSEETNVHNDSYGRDIYVKDVNGNLVRTSMTLNDFRVSIENIIKKYPNIKFINATEGGALIEGAENRKLREIIKELKKEKIAPMSKFFEQIDKRENVLIELENVLEQMKEYIKICKNGKSILKDYEMSYRLKNQNKIDVNIKKLNEIDRKIMEKNNKVDFMAIIVAKIIFEVENDEQFLTKNSDARNEIFMKELNKSKVLYSRIETSLQLYKEKIEKVINEIRGRIE